ncbi:hypothetical protein FQN57_006998, partial [Myotisia sp. PD_48]
HPQIENGLDSLAWKKGLYSELGSCEIEGMNSTLSPSQLLRIGRLSISSPIPRYLGPTTTSPLRKYVRSLTTTTSSVPTASLTTPPPPPPSSQNILQEPTSKHTTATLSQLPPGTSRKFGIVVSAGRMQRTVQVEHISTQLDKHIRKRFPLKTTYMVSDPCDSLREGDKIEFWSGRRSSKNVRHVVERIIVPFGSAIDERPPVKRHAERMEEDQRRRRELQVKALVKRKKARGEPAPTEEELAAITGELKMGKIKARVLRRMKLEEEKFPSS